MNGPGSDRICACSWIASRSHRVNRAQPRLVRVAADPRGTFVLNRHLCAQGPHCVVVAPSSISRLPGERIKTDQRDVMLLARLARSGNPHMVRVPDSLNESVRDLVRAREDAVRVSATAATASRRRCCATALPMPAIFVDTGAPSTRCACRVTLDDATTATGPVDDVQRVTATDEFADVIGDSNRR
ncbi:IS110 family transposase [Roseateles sp. LYH14W]|uniref:Transposase n=1 Tax=Pelomonas parva TaxID=3299032 RepID=A0ABW7EZR7_9BURK